MQYNKFRFYLYTCISAFFLILSFTLFYSLGYKYDFSTGKSFQTGAIVLKAVPTDVVITKDGTEVKQSGFLNGIWSSFVKIENLEAKTYNIRITKDGYNDWQKNILINAGQVGKYENIVLLKKGYKNLPVFENVALTDQKNFWPFAEKNKIVFYGKILGQEGLFLFDIENENQKLILDKSQLALMGTIQDVKLTEDDNKITLTTADNLYVVDLKDSKVYLVSSIVSKLLSQGPAGFYVYDEFVVYSQNGSVYFFNYITKEITKAIDGVSSFCVYQGGVYFFKTGETEDPSLYHINLNDPLIVTKVTSLPQTFNSKASFSIQKDNNRILILSDDSLYLIDGDSAVKKINSNVKEAHFFQSGKRILYYNDNEIWIYYTEDKASQPLKSQGENELLSRLSGKLSNVYLYSDEEHLFFQESGVLQFTEMDGRDNRNTFRLFDNPDGQDIFYVRDKNLLYFIKNGEIFKIDLKEV
jgi:hypothetical protein